MDPSPAIILVDRESKTPSGLVEILEHAGYTISVAHNGSEALSKLRRHHAAMILTPYALPI